MPARVSTYRSVSLTHEDLGAIKKVQSAWIKKNKVDISIAKMIRLAINEYEERHLS